MLEYKIITSYYYDGMGNKVMNIAEVDPDSVSAVGYRCNNDSSMYTLYGSCTECVDALGLKATYYGREAGGKTLALYDTDPGMTDVYNFPLSCTFNYKYIWLDDWYVYGSEADGRIATVDPKEIIAVNGSRMTGSEFPHPLNEYNASPPPDNLLPTAMRDTNIFGINASYRVQQRIPDFRRYEIKDHLGNVRTVIADYKNPDPATTASSIQFWRYKADVKNISNMYPYGKSYGTNAIYNAAEDYRYGFNGMEKEKNMDASGDITDFGARVFDANFPVFLSRDPLETAYPGHSSYIISNRNPIAFIDKGGKFGAEYHRIILQYAYISIGLKSAENVVTGVLRADDSENGALGFIPSFAWYGGSYQDIHFDGVVGYTDIELYWKDNIGSRLAQSALTGGVSGEIEFGMVLHTIADFYSHSNYIELYIDYYINKNGIPPGLESIPTFQNASNEFKDFLKSKGNEFRTGSFGLASTLIPGRFLPKDHHYYMHKDDPDSPQGSIQITPDNTYCRYAIYTAIQATVDILNSYQSPTAPSDPNSTTPTEINSGGSSNGGTSNTVPEEK